LFTYIVPIACTVFVITASFVLLFLLLELDGLLGGLSVVKMLLFTDNKIIVGWWSAE
jgi:hypothetical protein